MVVSSVFYRRLVAVRSKPIAPSVIILGSTAFGCSFFTLIFTMIFCFIYNSYCLFDSVVAYRYIIEVVHPFSPIRRNGAVYLLGKSLLHNLLIVAISSALRASGLTISISCRCALAVRGNTNVPSALRLV